MEYTIGLDVESDQEALGVALVCLVVAAVAYRDQVVERCGSERSLRSLDGGVLTACVVREASRVT